MLTSVAIWSSHLQVSSGSILRSTHICRFIPHSTKYNHGWKVSPCFRPLKNIPFSIFLHFILDISAFHSRYFCIPFSIFLSSFHELHLYPVCIEFKPRLGCVFIPIATLSCLFLCQWFPVFSLLSIHSFSLFNPFSFSSVHSRFNSPTCFISPTWMQFTSSKWMIYES